MAVGDAGSNPAPATSFNTRTMKKNIKTWAVESAVKLWGAVSFVGMFFVEAEDGSFKAFPFFIPCIISLLICAKTMGAMEKRGYFRNQSKTQ